MHQTSLTLTLDLKWVQNATKSIHDTNRKIRITSFHHNGSKMHKLFKIEGKWGKGFLLCISGRIKVDDRKPIGDSAFK